jgi:hypothetical protein
VSGKADDFAIGRLTADSLPDPAPVYSQATPAPGPTLAGPEAIHVRKGLHGKHWYLLISNDSTNPFRGRLQLQGLSKKQARALGLPSGSTPRSLYLSPGDILKMVLPFAPSSLNPIVF